MSICRFDVDNFTYNIESNLDALGLPVPNTIFSSVTTMSGALASIEAALMTKASDMPITAVASRAAGTTIAGITAAGYAGAIIGSALMASNRATSCSKDEFRKAFQSLGLPSWAADDALNQPNGHKLLRKQ
ncbi:hypothetical protein [Vibrio anguillarum]|uniref:hypothetical protein n=1 Tax=Vibrio anguillarum TaxID=55601 RepID=UPI000BB50FBF|nr:hypothetical protein [Vibrio anguillarum]ATC60335.1 hypothetical protein CMV05_23380 [Vibrio anguillarum]MBF4249460.1 hypothetical protein [Vibrio anguillarum]